MDGEIWVTSTPGAGSTFFFTAVFKIGLSEKLKNIELPPVLKGTRTLIVESNSSTAMVIKRFLETFGFTTMVATDSQSAVARYENAIENNNPFGLLLIDVKLPDIDGIDTAMIIKSSEKTTSAPPVIIISPYGREMDIQRARNLGFDHFLLKPIKQSILFDTIMEIFGYTISRPDKDPMINTKPDEFINTRILLVEDNPINQMVALEVLTMAGITVDKTENGKEAIERLKTSYYDVVLMDVQMPVMDGIEATKIIRNELNLRELPIIAMTAHAMYGDKERCIDAGMTDYISKPIDRGQLFSAIRRHVSHVRNLAVALKDKGVNGHPYSLPGLNIGEALKRLGGSWDVFNAVLIRFQENYADFTERFRIVLENKNFKKARIEAHSLKGVAANISAGDLTLAAAALEEACAQKNVVKALTALNTVEDSMNQLAESIALAITPTPIPREEDRDAASENSDIDVAELLKNLDIHLQESDPVETPASFNRIKTAFGNSLDSSELGGLLFQLEEEVNRYNYDEARQILNQFAGMLK
jgi:CheY-like chemotaxis protein/HPt (histidine-containing phosphotransfer) domain-containing protein